MRRNHHGGEDRSGRIRYDFSVNINPLGMPEAAKTALLSGWDIFENYPDDSCEALREALGARYGIGSDRIVCGNGASDLIYRLCLSAGFHRVLLPEPAFSEYERALRAAGCEAVPLFTEEDSGFVLEEKHVSQISESFDALFLCNPSNPAGGLMEKPLIERIVRQCDEMGVLLVADECFLDFVRGGEEHSAVWAAAEGKNVVVIKAFTKIFAMAGLRLGFALFGDEGLAKETAQFGAPWQVSGPAQAAGLAVLGAAEYSAFIEAAAAYVEAERRVLEEGLKGFGFSVVKGFANFILFRAPNDLDKLLEREGFSIRNCSDYRFRAPAGEDEVSEKRDVSAQSDAAAGCSGGERTAPADKNMTYYRIAVRKGFENQLLLAAVGRCVRWL